MCKAAENILFCACAEITQINPRTKFPAKKLKRDFYENEYLETRLTWDLHHYLGQHELDMVGLFHLPTQKINEDLTEEFILEELNNHDNLFDFDYLPKDGDILYIRKSYFYADVKHKWRPFLSDYMAFIYTKNIWLADIHDAFSTEIQEFAKGQMNENYNGYNSPENS